jgi:vacuolar-type H+-ATPase subunit E/Vma4
MATIGQKKAALAAHRASGAGSGRFDPSSFAKQSNGTYESSTGQTSPYKSVNTTGKYEATNGLKFNTQKEAAAQNTKLGTNPKTNNQSLTTLSSDKSNDIYTNNTKLDQYSEKGVTTDPETGISKTASGTAYEPIKEVEADTRDEDDAINSYYDSLQKSLDSITQSKISNAKMQYDQLRAEQAKINASAEKQTQNALLMGGVTGQGSSAQYAPISSVGIMQSQMSYGLKKIAALDAEENNIIAEAKQAQMEGNFRIVEKKLAMVEEKRKEKIDAASKLNEQIAKANEKALEDAKVASREMAITDLYSQGITDPAEMQRYLNETGGDITLSEIKNTVDLISGIGGTGIVLEYNTYKADAMSRGQIPVSFMEYQDIDANRKKSVAKAGIASSGGSGITATTNFTDAQVKKIESSPEAKKLMALKDLEGKLNAYREVAAQPEKFDITGSRKAIADSLYADLKIAYKEAANLGALTGPDVAIIQEAIKPTSGGFGALVSYKAGGGQKGVLGSIDTALATLKRQKENNSSTLVSKWGDVDPYIQNLIGKENNMSTDLIEVEDQAKNKVINYGKINPKFQPILIKKVNEINPYTGNKYTFTELLQIYPEIK